MLSKQRLKLNIQIARMTGLAESLASGLTWQEFNKEGAIKTAKEIVEIGNKLLESK